MTAVFKAPWIIVIFCAAIHLSWAALLPLYPEAAGGTATSALLGVFKNENVLAAVLAISAATALLAANTNLPWSIMLLFPQQSLLMISATGAINAVVLAQYADGVIRPRAFIFADQVPVILAAVAHGVAIVVTQLRNERIR